MDRVISRRKLLSTAALGCAAVGLGVAAAPKARAFSLEEPSQPVAAQYLAARNACSTGADAFHRQIIADVQAQLSQTCAGGPAATDYVGHDLSALRLPAGLITWSRVLSR